MHPERAGQLISKPFPALRRHGSLGYLGSPTLIPHASTSSKTTWVIHRPPPQKSRSDRTPLLCSLESSLFLRAPLQEASLLTAAPDLGGKEVHTQVPPRIQLPVPTGELPETGMLQTS